MTKPKFNQTVVTLFTYGRPANLNNLRETFNTTEGGGDPTNTTSLGMTTSSHAMTIV